MTPEKVDHAIQRSCAKALLLIGDPLQISVTDEGTTLDGIRTLYFLFFNENHDRQQIKRFSFLLVSCGQITEKLIGKVTETMSVNKYVKYPTEVIRDTDVTVDSGSKTKQKLRLSTKVFSITMLGCVAIIVVDGLRNPSNDPVWALTCLLMGIPIAFLGVYELFMKR